MFARMILLGSLTLFVFSSGCADESRQSQPESESNAKIRSDVPAKNAANPEPSPQSRLAKDLRPEWMKQIYGLSDYSISLAEKYLLDRGIDRKYNVVGSFVGGYNKLELELLPSAKSHQPLHVLITFVGSECQALPREAALTKWLELDESMLATQTKANRSAR